MLTAVNQCHPFELHNPMLFLLSNVLTLVFTFYLDKNLGWVTDGNAFAEYPGDF